MSERLTRIVRGMLGHVALSHVSGLPPFIMNVLLEVYYKDLLDELTKIDEVEGYDLNDYIAWFVGHMVDEVRGATAEGHVEEVLELQTALQRMLHKIDLTQYPDLEQRLAALTEHEELDLSVWENYMEERDNGPVE